MRNLHLLSATLLTASLALTSAAYAGIDYTFTGNISNDWHDSSNWSPSGIPGADDSATIPTTKTCNITNYDEEIDHFTIEKGPGSVGTLYVAPTRTLVVYGANYPYDSTIDGHLNLDASSTGGGISTLAVGGSMTFLGTGQVIATRSSGQTGFGRILSCPTGSCAWELTIGDQLTFKGSVVFDKANIVLGASVGHQAKLLVNSAYDIMVLGGGDDYMSIDGGGALEVTAGSALLWQVLSVSNTTTWEIDVAGGQLDVHADAYLINADFDLTVDSGTVNVDTDMSVDTLTINGGTTDFTAEFADGNVTVTGGTLTFDEACSPTGSFTISGGLVDVNDALSTSGAIAVSGGTLQYDYASSPSGTLAVSGTGLVDVNAALSSSGAITVSGGTLRYDAASSPSSTFTISGGLVDVNYALSSSGAITVSGGTLQYDAASSPSSAFTISSGTLDANAAWSPSGSVGLSGGTLRFDAASSPTGGIAVSSGTCYVTEDVSAAGLTWTGGAFIVSSGKSIEFVP